MHLEEGKFRACSQVCLTRSVFWPLICLASSAECLKLEVSESPSNNLREEVTMEMARAFLVYNNICHLVLVHTLLSHGTVTTCSPWLDYKLLVHNPPNHLPIVDGNK